MKKSILLSILFFSMLCFFTSCEKNKIEDNLILVEGDEFIMGDNTLSLPWGFYSHKEHYVVLSSFYVSPYEVTQYEFNEIMEYNPSFYQGEGISKQPSAGENQESRPVENITWYEAVVYCNKLSEKMGLTPVYSKMIFTGDNEKDETMEVSYTSDTTLWGETPTVATAKTHVDWNMIQWDKKANGYRLLTEAEWEYTSKGGATDQAFNSSGFNYDSKEYYKYSWSEGNSDGKTHETGLLEPNALGIYDLTGNVWEWCWDWFDEDYYLTEDVQKNPSGPESGDFRCLRGSAWDDAGVEMASIVRGSASPYIKSRRGGFRICRNIK